MSWRYLRINIGETVAKRRFIYYTMVREIVLMVKHTINKAQALILIITKMGKVYDVAKQLRNIIGVESIMVVTGSWDIAALLSFEQQELGRLIREIQSLQDIVQTMTLIVIPEIE